MVNLSCTVDFLFYACNQFPDPAIFVFNSETIKIVNTWYGLFIVISNGSQLSKYKSEIIKSARDASRDFTIITRV